MFARIGFPDYISDAIHTFIPRLVNFIMLNQFKFKTLTFSKINPGI